MAVSRTFLVLLGFAFLAYFAVEAHWFRRVNPIMECVVVHPDGSVTACFGYENFEEDDFDIEFGDDNDFEVCSRRDWRQIRRVIRPRRIPDRPGRTAFYPNCTFTVTFPRDCDCRWRLFGKLARATRSSQRCPAQDTTKPWFDKCPGTLPAVATDAKKSTKTLNLLASAQDNNPGVTITNTLTTATGGSLTYAFPLGSTTFNFVATDSAGNSATCPVVVPVIDTEPPVATASSPFACKTDPGKNYATVPANKVKASATDNDPRAITITNSGNTGAQPGADARGQYPIGTTIMTFVAKDFSLNPSSPVQTTVTVTDDEKPLITCPATASGALTALSNQAQVSITLTGVSDNSGTPTVKVTTGTGTVTVAAPYNYVANYGLGQTVVTFTATDAYLNSKSCSTTVTVTDAIAPVMTCGANINHGTDQGLQTYTATVGASATDNSGVNPTFDAPGNSVTRAFPLGATVVPFTARDGSNNAASCSVTVTVSDQESPVVTCPAPLTVSTAVGGAFANFQVFSARAVDNVAVTSLTQDCDPAAQATINADGSADLNTATTGTCLFPIGTKTVTWTARDAANNVGTCTGTVIVRDTEAPVFPQDSCAPVSVVTEPGKPDAAVTTSVAATDNSQGTITYSYQVGSGASQSGSAVSRRFPAGLTNVVFTATDASGNSASCTVVVTVQDNQPPQLDLREPPAQPGSNTLLTIIKAVGPGQTSASVDLTVFASDNVAVAQAGIVGITEGVSLSLGFVWYTAVVPAGQTVNYVFYAVDPSVQRTEMTISIQALAGDPCVPNPCLNGATCSANGAVAVCECAAGFIGPLCETALSCGVKQPFTISACPLDVPVEVKMTCTSGVTWTFTWTALSGPANYDIGPLNNWLATQHGNTVLCAKNLMTPEGDYVFRVTGTSGATSFTADTTVKKENGATPSISISGVPDNALVSRNHPLALTAVLEFPPESCLRSEPYKSTWTQIDDSRTFIDMSICEGNPADPPEVLAATTRICTIPPWSLELSPWTWESFEYPTYVNWDARYWYTFKVCASPINDIAAHSVCATTQIREIRGQKINAMITGWRVDHYELGPIGIPVTSNQLPYNMDPSPLLWIYPHNSMPYVDPTIVSLDLYSARDNYFTTEAGFQAFTDPPGMPPRAGTVDFNQPPNDPKLIYEWDCVSAWSWSRCFAGWLPPKCCEIQAGITRLGFINRNDQPKFLVPMETVATFNRNIYPDDPEDWSFYSIRVKIYPEGHPELGDSTHIVARPNNDGPNGPDILPVLCGLLPTISYQMAILSFEEYVPPDIITVEQAYMFCLARFGNESVPWGPWDPLSAPSAGMQLQAEPTTGITIKWHEMNDKLDLSKWDNTMGLSLDPSLLTAGTEYKMCYTQTTVATGATAQGCTRFKYDPKPPACTGSTCMFVSPSTGTALKDKFTISVDGFKTQHTTPLRYVFKYIAPGTIFEVPLSDLQLHSSASAVLPAGEITLVVYAYDEKNLFTRQTLKVTVKKPEGSEKCSALDTVKTLLADAERSADALTAVDLITAITSYFRASPGAITCNGVDQTQTISEARTRFLRLLDLYSQAASKSSSRANQWANALSGVSAMFRSGAAMSAEERRTALAVVDRILTGMNTMTALTDSILAGTNVMSIVSDLAGSGDCQLAADLKSRITQIHRLLFKHSLPNAQWANKQPNVEAHVQRIQTNSAWNIKPKTSKPINIFIPASALKPTESFVDVAVITFTAPALRNCRAAAPKSSSIWHSEAVEKTGLQGSLVSNPVEVEIFSANKGTRMQLEGLDEPIKITMVSDSSCGNSASVCGSWADSTWSGAGCSVAAADDSSVTCACTHVSEFGVVSTGESCNSFNAGYAVVFAAYGVGAVIAAVVMGGFYVRKSSHLSTKIAMFSVIAVVAICRLISGLYFAGAGGSQGLTDVVLAIPFGLYFFVNTQLFERVRQASSPTALAASKLTGLFKLYYGFFTLGLGALIVAAFYTGSTHNVIAMSTTRVLAGASMLAALLFGVNGVLARPVGSSPDVSLFRTYLLASFCVLVGSLIWVALATDALTAGLLLPVDLVWGLAIANLYRRDGEVKSAAPKAASGEQPTAAAV